MINTIITFLPWIQVVLAILLVITVLLQNAEESLGGAFGGSDDHDGHSHTRRGAEKVMFKVTIIIAILFVAAVFLPTLLGL